MSLFARLTHPVGNEQKIPSHQFMAALAELGRGEFTRVEVRTLHLAWNPNPGAIDGYIIYFGPSADTASTQVSDISLTAPGFDPLAPAVEYDADADLGLSAGDTVCFRLKAYNANGTSGFSEGVCITL